MREGGGYILSPSLTGTAMSIMKHFKASDFLQLQRGGVAALPPLQLQGQTALGLLTTLRSLPELSKTPLEYEYGLLSPMGSDLPIFPGSGEAYDVNRVQPNRKGELLKSWAALTKKKTEQLRNIAAKAGHSEGHEGRVFSSCEEDGVVCQ